MDVTGIEERVTPSEVYFTLAECFKEPGAAFARDVASGLLQHVLTGAGAALGLPVDGAALRIDGATGAVQAQLVRAYHALFTVPSARFVLPVESAFKPWQGADGFLTGEGMIMGPPALDMAARYRARGLVVPPAMKDTPDHLTLLLEYAGLVSGEGAGAELQAFVAAHLDEWVEAFVADAESFAAIPFYGALARVLGAFVQAERRRLGAAATA